MIEWIVKGNAGRKSNIGRKEVVISINKDGLDAKGNERRKIAIRFTNESVKKASQTGFVRVGVDKDTKRIYFSSAQQKDGYQLTTATRKGTPNSVTITVVDIEKWKSYVGEYNMKKDLTNDLYYIDVPAKEVES